MLSHRNLMAMTVAHLADFDSPDENCSLIHGAPMSHGSGLYIPPYVLRGVRQVVPESSAFEPEEFLDLCEHHPGGSAFLAPTMVARLVQTGRACPSNLRTVVYGGGPMYVDSLKKAMAAFGPIFVQLYGQGEAPMTITGLRRADHVDADDAILGSVGYARSGVDVAVLRADGRPAAAGEIGEIVCRGDVVMSGYWHNPEATAATLQDGWLRTGDMGSFDDAGYLTLRDRSKDVVISGGSNIYPREVEEVLLEHPGVDEAGVVGAPDAGVGRDRGGVHRRLGVAPPNWTRICSSASHGSSGLSDTSSSRNCRRTATARCSSAICAPGSPSGLFVPRLAVSYETRRDGVRICTLAGTVGLTALRNMAVCASSSPVGTGRSH